MDQMLANPAPTPPAKGKRAFLQVTRDVLEVARQGARPTHIMYRANLNHAQLNRYLSRLIDSGLLWVDPDRRIYSLTEQGTRFIRDYDEMKQAEELSETKNVLLLGMLNGTPPLKLRPELAYG